MRQGIMIILSLAMAMAVQGRPSLSRLQAEAERDSIVSQWKQDIRKKYAEAWQSHEIKIDSLTMPFWIKFFGNKPAGGYSMYISLHGGGNAPSWVNNQQYENQKVLYTPENSLYFVPRAPYDDWDMWFKPRLDEFYEAIIDMGIALGDVNPDKIYIMGYSAGGDGVWRMATRMADQWAAASMMAGHPGNVSTLSLRNTPFMIWCGALDAAYDRNKLDTYRGQQMDSLQAADPEGYIHETHIVAGKPHWMDRQDTAAVAWMAHYTRNPYPKKIVWCQQEVLRPSFYWITVPKDEMVMGKQVRLEVKGNEIDITRCDYKTITLSLNDEIVDLDRKVKVRYQGKTIFNGRLKRSAETLRSTLYQRNDPKYAFPAQVSVKVKN